MVEKPTLYEWLLKIAIVVTVVILGYIFIHIDRLFPNFKNTLVFRFIITPALYIIGFAAVMFFILL